MLPSDDKARVALLSQLRADASFGMKKPPLIVGSVAALLHQCDHQKVDDDSSLIRLISGQPANEYGSLVATNSTRPGVLSG
jgi:hypothetical protein